MPDRAGPRAGRVGDRLDRFLANPRRAVWTLALPMMAGFAIHGLYAIVDTAFVGKIGPEALAGITFVAPLFFVAIALAQGLGTGVTATVAQAFGRRDRVAAGRLASEGLAVALGMGLVVMVAMEGVGGRVLRAMGADGETMAQAWAYLSTVAAAFPFMFVAASLRAILTGTGDSRTPMVIMAIATMLNLGLDPILIFWAGLGIRGAAMATVAAPSSSVVMYALAMWRRDPGIRLVPTRPRWADMSKIAIIGAPAAVNQLVMALGNGLGNRVVVHFDQIAVAAYGAATKVDLIVSMPVIGLAGAMVSLVGMFSGAGRPDLVRTTATYVYRWVITLALALGVVAFSSSEHVLRIFTKDPRALAIGSQYLGFMLFAYPMMAFGMTSGRLLQGLGFGLPPLLITLVRVLVVGIPLAYVSVFWLGLPIWSIWASFIAGGLVSDLMSLVWIRRHVYGPGLAGAHGASSG